LKAPTHRPGSATVKGLDLLRSDNCAPVKLARSDTALYEKYLSFDQVRPEHEARPPNWMSYSETRARPGELCTHEEAWSRKAILVISTSRKFSSNGTFTAYATDLWQTRPCRVENRTAMNDYLFLLKHVDG
jgi:hypothetical protein